MRTDMIKDVESWMMSRTETDGSSWDIKPQHLLPNRFLFFSPFSHRNRVPHQGDVFHKAHPRQTL